MINLKSCSIFFAILLVSVELGSCLQCLSCNTEKGCKKPKKIVCTPEAARDTHLYLDQHYKNAPNNTSPTFECLKHNVEFVSYPKTVYKGCTYTNIDACNLLVRDHYAVHGYTRSCRKCATDNCNPAGRAVVSSFVLVMAVFAGIIYKFM